MRFPSAFGKELRELLKNLVCVDVTLRFGALKSGARDIKDHAWFSGFDWAQVQARTLPAPYVPPLAVCLSRGAVS